jgi:hypothetical protein
MKGIIVKIAVFMSVSGGAIMGVAHGASARLAGNHCEPAVVDD